MKQKNKSLVNHKTNQHDTASVICQKRCVHKTLTSKSILLLILFAICLLSTNTALAAKIYWVGGLGNWDEMDHWSLTSGDQTRVTPTAIPNTNDDVEFNEHSGFTASSRTVTINQNVFVHDFLFKGTGVAPIVSGAGRTLNIYGSLELQSNMTLTASTINFLSPTAVTITSNGVTLPSNLNFDNATGAWTLQDDLNVVYLSPAVAKITFTAGTFDTNNKMVTARSFTSGGSGIRSLKLGSSIIKIEGLTYQATFWPATVTYACDGWNYTGSNCTLDAGTSLISLEGYHSILALPFSGATGHKYYDIKLRNTCTPFGTGYTQSTYVAEQLNGNIEAHRVEFNTPLNAAVGRYGYLVGSCIIDELIFTNRGRTDGTNTINTLICNTTTLDNNGEGMMIYGTGSVINEASLLSKTAIYGSNTIKKLNINGGMRYRLQGGTTQTIDELVRIPSNCQAIEMLGFGTGVATIESSQAINIDDVALSNIKATGGGVFTANGLDLLGNVDWTFTNNPFKTLYWVGGAGAWGVEGHWSTTSGGAPEICIPDLMTNVIFDDNSGFSAASKTVSLGVPAYCRNLQFLGTSSIAPAFVDALRPLYIWGSLEMQQGMTYDIYNNNFIANTSGHTIKANKAVTTANAKFTFDHIDGIWTFIDKANFGPIIFNNGKIVVADTLTTLDFNSTLGTRSLDFSSAVINVLGTTGTYAGKWIYSGTGASLISTNSLLTINGSNPNITTLIGQVYHDITMNVSGTSGISFDNQYYSGGGGGITANDVILNAPSGTVYLCGNNTFNNLSFKAAKGATQFATIKGSNTITNTIEFEGNGDFEKSNTANKIILGDGKAYWFRANTQQTINEMTTTTTGCNGLVTLGGASNSKITLPTGKTIHLDYAYIYNMIGDGDIGAFTASGKEEIASPNVNWLFTPLPSKNLYWVGGGGNWNDPLHWSETSGVIGTGCVPTYADNVFFDENSGVITAASPVNIPATAECHDITWNGVPGTPTFTSASNQRINIYGSSTWQAGMKYTVSLTMYLSTDIDTKTITSNGVIMQGRGDYGYRGYYGIYFNGTAKWKLMDNFQASTQTAVRMENGTLDTDGFKFSAEAFVATLTAKGLNLGSSIIEMAFSGSSNYDPAAWRYQGANLDAGTSHIIIAGGRFYGFDHTYYDVTINAYYAILSEGIQYNNVTFNYQYGVSGGAYPNYIWHKAGRVFNNLTLNTNTEIQGSNTITNKLLIHNATLVTLTAGTTQTAGNFEMRQTNACVRMQVASSSTTAQANINTPIADFSTVSNATIQGINSRGVNFTLQSLDLGNNTNVTCTPMVGKTFYWVGGAGNWSDPTKWSFSSGGPANLATGCPPNELDDVIFDDNSNFSSASNALRTVVLDVTGGCKGLSFKGTLVKPIFGSNYGLMNIYGNLLLQEGMTYNVWRTNFMSINPTTTSSGPTAIIGGGTNGNTFNFNVPNSVVELGSDLNFPNAMWRIENGSFFTKGYNMAVYDFFTASAVTKLDITGSTVTVGGTWYFQPVAGRLFATQSKLIVGAFSLYVPIGQVYHNITIKGATGDIPQGITADSVIFMGAGTISGGTTASTAVKIKNLYFNSNATITGNNTLDTVYIKGTGSFSGSNTYKQLAFSPNNQTHTFAGGSTQTITDKLYWSGSPCKSTLIRRSGSGQANFALTNHNTSDFINVQDINMSLQRMMLQRNSVLGINTTGVDYTPGTGGLIGLGDDSNVCSKNFPYTLTTDGFFPGPEATAKWYRIQNLPSDATVLGTNHTFTITEPGKYSILHDWGNACSVRDTITVARFAEVTVATANVVYPVCGVDKADIIVVSPLGSGYQYHFELKTAPSLVFQASPTFTDMPAGDYWLVVQEDGNCVSDSTSVTIRAPYLPATVADITITDASICASSSAILTPSSTTIAADRNPVFRWYADAALTTPIISDVSSAGVFTTPALTATTTYYLTVSCDTLCENAPNTAQAVTITTIPLPNISITNIESASCGLSDGAFTVVASAGTAPYQYSLDNSTWGNNPVFTGLPVGSYMVYVKDVNCDAIPVNVLIPSKANTSEAYSFGDAPISYGTASHKIEECVYIGGLNMGLVQPLAMPSETALTAMNDDGFSNPFIDGFSNLAHADFSINAQGKLVVKVKASNFGTVAAKLFAWIDFDQNGTFDASEATSATSVVAVGDNNIDKYLEFSASQTNAMRNGVTYLRLRISPDNDLTAAKATGDLVNGEVEDYRLNFDLFNITKTAKVKGKAAPADQANIGDTIVYSLNITNKHTNTTIFGVFDMVPTYTIHISGGALVGDKVDWGSVTLTAGETQTLSFEARVADYPKLDPAHQIHNIAYMYLGTDTINSALDCYTAPITVETLRADDDCAIMFKGGSLANHPINANDTEPKREVVGQDIIVNGTRGTAFLNADGTLNYTLHASETNFVGLDSIQYHITVPNDKDSAWVRIAIVDPLGEFTACAGSIRIGMKPIPNVTYTWYQLDGTPIPTHTDGTDDITINMGTADTVFHVAATIGTCTTDRLEVKVKKSELVSVPDIRVQVCPQTSFSIDLHSLIDVEYYVKAKFTNSVLGLSGTEGTSELLHSSTLQTNPGTHKILYTFESLCGTSDAVIYLKTLSSSTPDIRDTIKICKDFAANIHLKQILGLEVLGGTWANDISLSPIGNYVSVLNGAYVFNGNKAWADGKGTLVEGNRHFVFKYTIPSGNACMPGQDRELVIVLTPDIIN